MVDTARPYILSDAKGVASYLVSLRPILSRATEARNLWVTRLGALMADTRHGDASLVAKRASQVGREHGDVFRETARDLDRLPPPGECADCARQLAAWLRRLAEACDLLVEIGKSGELRRLRETQSPLTKGRVNARAFNEEYARLCRALKDHVVDVKSRRRAGGSSFAARARADRRAVTGAYR